MSEHSLLLNIADVGVRVTSAVDFKRFNDFGFYRDFVTRGPGPVDCSLAHVIGPPPDLGAICERFSISN